MERDPVCRTCKDTHTMTRHDSSEVPCTSCPLPCQFCRGDEGRGAYCETPHCLCLCHKKSELVTRLRSTKFLSLEIEGVRGNQTRAEVERTLREIFHMPVVCFEVRPPFAAFALAEDRLNLPSFEDYHQAVVQRRASTDVTSIRSMSASFEKFSKELNDRLDEVLGELAERDGQYARLQEDRNLALLALAEFREIAHKMEIERDAALDELKKLKEERKKP